MIWEPVWPGVSASMLKFSSRFNPAEWESGLCVFLAFPMPDAAELSMVQIKPVQLCCFVLPIAPAYVVGRRVSPNLFNSMPSGKPARSEVRKSVFNGRSGFAAKQAQPLA